MNKGKIIGMKEAGMSNRAIAKATGHDRKTISKIWNEYILLTERLKESDADVKVIKAQMTEDSKYDSSGRSKRKYTEELDARLKEIVEQERKKDRLMGSGHKQKLTNKQIYEKLIEEGYDIT